jgi:Protein of unknown function (DUF3616)
MLQLRSMKRALVIALSLAFSQCKCAKPHTKGPKEKPHVEPIAQTVEKRDGFRQVTFVGACDASGAVPLTKDVFAVADDEDNILRQYSAQNGGEALDKTDVSPFLELRQKHPESDIEAATRIGDVAYWLTSHGRNKKGDLKPERSYFFATTLPSNQLRLSGVGSPQSGLQEELIAQFDPDFHLQAASERPPNVPEGFNIEGLTATLDGKLLIGFRNPIPHGKALIVLLENPRAVLDGAKAQFGTPILLELEGLGIRGLSWWHGKYLIIGGPFDNGPSKLFTWEGPGHVAALVAVDLSHYNPEGFFTPEDADEIMLLSDDGTSLIEGKPCKTLKKHEGPKRFRGIWLRPF